MLAVRLHSLAVGTWRVSDRLRSAWNAAGVQLGTDSQVAVSAIGEGADSPADRFDQRVAEVGRSRLFGIADQPGNVALVGTDFARVS